VSIQRAALVLVAFYQLLRFLVLTIGILSAVGSAMVIALAASALVPMLLIIQLLMVSPSEAYVLRSPLRAAGFIQLVGSAVFLVSTLPRPPLSPIALLGVLPPALLIAGDAAVLVYLLLSSGVFATGGELATKGAFPAPGAVGTDAAPAAPFTTAREPEPLEIEDLEEE
jgi:hypothetical protein